MKTKSHVQVAFVVLIAAGAFGGAAWLRLQGPARHAKAPAFDAAAYQNGVVVRYQEKSKLIASIFAEIKTQDPNINGILVHVPHWRASSARDAAEIEELNTHLDTWVSARIPEIQSQTRRSPRLKSMLAKLSELDRTLADERARLLPARL